MSRKKAGKTKKAAPIKLAWLDQIIRHEWPDKPAKNSMIAVGAILATYADPDGRNCFPSVRTIAGDAGIKYATAIDCIKTMRSAGMLEREGKASNGQNRYRLCLVAMPDETLPDIEQTALSVAPSVAPRGTQLPTLDRKGEGGGDSSPDGNTPAAVATGSKTGDAKTIMPAVMIDDDRANRIIIDFITAFDARFAERARGKTVATQRLEPHHDKLRLQIITKIDAGWPQDHLIDRIIGGLPGEDRGIRYLTGFVASKIEKLPDRPDHTAQLIINEGKVAAAAQIKLDEADRKRRETDKADQAERLLEHQTDRRNQAINRYRQALERYGTSDDIDASVTNYVSWLDSTADEEPLDRQAGWPLSKEWIAEVEDEIKYMTDYAKEGEQKFHEALGELNLAHYYFGITEDDADRELEQIMAQVGLSSATMSKPRNVDQSIAAIKSHIDERWGDVMRTTGKTMHELAHEKMSATVIDPQLNHIPETAGDIW